MISNAEDDVRNVKEAKNPVRKIHSRELLQRSNDSGVDTAVLGCLANLLLFLFYSYDFIAERVGW